MVLIALRIAAANSGLQFDFGVSNMSLDYVECKLDWIQKRGVFG
jgi:hypothetical protein